MTSATDHRSARRRTLIGSGLVAVLAAVLIAIVVVRSTGEKVLNENADTLVLVGKDDAGSDTAARSGVLTDVGGCLGWDDTVIIWPHGTTVSTPEPLRVRVDGQTYKIGDTVELTGATTEPLDASSYFHDKVPAGCQAAGLFIVE